MNDKSVKDVNQESILSLRQSHPNMFIGGQRDPKSRICLKCSGPIISEGFHNRICDICRFQNKNITPEFVSMGQGAEMQGGSPKGGRIFAKKINDSY